MRRGESRAKRKGQQRYTLITKHANGRVSTRRGWADPETFRVPADSTVHWEGVDWRGDKNQPVQGRGQRKRY